MNGTHAHGAVIKEWRETVGGRVVSELKREKEILSYLLVYGWNENTLKTNCVVYHGRGIVERTTCCSISLPLIRWRHSVKSHPNPISLNNLKPFVAKLTTHSVFFLFAIFSAECSLFLRRSLPVISCTVTCFIRKTQDFRTIIFILLFSFYR